MSSCLCKKSEGAVFPLFVQSVKDRIEDSIHALDIDKANHWSCPPSDFHEAAFDGIGGAKLLPEMLGKIEKAQQFRQVLFQLPHHAGICFPPFPRETLKSGSRFLKAVGPINGLRRLLHGVVVPLPNFFQDVAHLVHPAALMLRFRVDRLDRSG